MKIVEKWPDVALNLAENRGILRKCVSRGSKSLDLTIGGQVRKVLLVAPNGSERSETLGRGNLARNTFRDRTDFLRAFECVGVVCELDSVFVFCFYACFLFLSIFFGWDCLPCFLWWVFRAYCFYSFVRRV